MSNIKRAIEAQVDSIIGSLGYDYKVFDNRGSYKKTKEFISNYYEEDNVAGITSRLKLLNILGMAPLLLISSIRHLRNEMEHEYIILLMKSLKRL